MTYTEHNTYPSDLAAFDKTLGAAIWIKSPWSVFASDNKKKPSQGGLAASSSW
jgi:hypothetical protein